MSTVTLVRPDHETGRARTITPAPRSLPAGDVSVVIVDNGKPKARELMGLMVDQLAALQFGIASVRVVSKPAATATLTPDQAREIAAAAQLVLAGLGDCGACSACSLHDVAQMEALGVPSVLIHTDPFQGLVAEFGRSLGLVAPPAVSVPHPVSSRDSVYLAAVAAAAADQLCVALVGRPEPVGAL
jgi:hypothetical protein